MIIVMQVIVSTEATKGEGTNDDPTRVVTRIFDMTGQLLYEIDPFVELQQKKQP